MVCWWFIDFSTDFFSVLGKVFIFGKFLTRLEGNQRMRNWGSRVIQRNITKSGPDKERKHFHESFMCLFNYIITHLLSAPQNVNKWNNVFINHMNLIPASSPRGHETRNEKKYRRSLQITSFTSRPNTHDHFPNLGLCRDRERGGDDYKPLKRAFVAYNLV